MLVFGFRCDYFESPRVLVGCGSLRASLSLRCLADENEFSLLLVRFAHENVASLDDATAPSPLPCGLIESSRLLQLALERFFAHLTGEVRNQMSTTMNAVLDAVQTMISGRPQTMPTTTCRHPPSEQSILFFEDRALHGCEWCGELLNRRPHPLPEIDAPVREYEASRSLRRIPQ